MPTAYIALGSNLDDPRRQVSAAIASISQLPKTRLIDQSRRYQTEAVGPGDQPDYINAAITIDTELTPLQLLDALQQIENQQGRVRLERWGARTLDLDILLYEQLSLNTDRLTIPHPRLHERNFVLLPLHDLDQKLSLPDGTTVASLLENCPTAGIVALSEGE